MIYNLLWRIAAACIRFLRLCDTDISADHLWKIRIHKLVNCWAMPPTNFIYSAFVGCRYLVKRNKNKVESFAYMETPKHAEFKILEEESPPKVIVRVYIPFKTEHASIQLKISDWITDHEEYLAKTIDLLNIKPGIHYVTFDLEDIFQHFSKKGFNA